jgi:hypothetical protein
LGIISRRCSTNPPDEAIPAAVRYYATLYHPLLYGSRTAPPKEDGGALERGTDAHLAPAQDNAVTSDQQDASPPSPSALCGHSRCHDAIPGTATPSPTLWEYGATRRCHSSCCAPYGFPSAAPLEPAYERRPNGKPPHHHPRSRSRMDTGHATTPYQQQDSPGRPSTLQHCAPYRYT